MIVNKIGKGIVACAIVLAIFVSIVVPVAALGNLTYEEVVVDKAGTAQSTYAKFHYYNMTYYPNGDLKSVTYVPCDRYGYPKENCEETTIDYTQQEAFRFHGCKCEQCKNNTF